MRKTYRWSLGGRSLELGRRSLIMGIVNVTPDSFYDGGRHETAQAAVDHALALVEQGADILDIGGESTRPYSDGIDLDEELERVVPVIEALAPRCPVPISIDTTKAAVAKAALGAGATIINDISGLRLDPEMIPLAAKTGCGVVLMHMRGTPKDMQDKTDYGALLPELTAELKEAVEAALAGGIRREAIVIDPGIGFSKTPEHNLQLIREIEEIARLGFPLLLGPSRKSFIGHCLEAAGLPAETDQRLIGTMAAAAVSAFLGGHILRVHDVAEARQALAVADAIREGSLGPWLSG